MEWAGIAGGRCPGASWRIGVAGSSVGDPQRVFLLNEKDWQWLSELLPWSQLREYGDANGLLFEPLQGVDTQGFDALLQVVLTPESEPRACFESPLRRYLLLLDAGQRCEAVYEHHFARIFMPGCTPLSDERQICLNPFIEMAEQPASRPFATEQLAVYGREGIEDVSKAHFAYCEGTERVSGWLSDCWLDCLRTGMVPVHVADWLVPAWIPETAYVDGRRFPDREALELFLDTMAPEVYQAMVEVMRSFLVGPDGYPYSPDAWINVLTAAIAADAIQVRGYTPLISVIIPSYNYGRFVGQAVASVLSQGVQSLEILVLDNASSDETSEVMKSFATDPRVRFMRNRRNIGPSHNVLNGMRIATGQFMTVLMADDILLSGHFLRLLPLLQEHPESALGYAPVNYIDDQAAPLASPRHPGHRLTDYVGDRNEVADLLVYDNYITPSATIIRRQALLSGWSWNPRLKGAGDWDMAVQLAERNPDFIFTHIPGVGYRVHSEQHSTEFYASTAPLEDHILIVEGVFERGAERQLSGRELEVAAHLRGRLGQYPNEQHSPLGTRVQSLCVRLEALAAFGERALFSIILTTYNRPDLLKDALASVGCQTLRDFEVILINDNGEPVEHLLAAYDFPITYIRQGRNQGLSAARNAGLVLARGRFIVYLDDDDIYLSNHLAVLAEAFVQHPLSVVYTGVEYVSERLEAGRRIEVGRSQPYRHDVFDRDRLFAQNYIPVNTWAHPRDMLGVVGEFDTGLAAFEDWDMLLRLSSHYPFVHVPVVTSEVHTREQNTSGDHMLGRERKNFPALYQLLYQRYPGSASETLKREREDMLQRLGVSVGRCADVPTLQRWLAERLPTETENRLINQYLQERDGGPLIGIIVLDLEGQSPPLMQTLKSLIGERCLYATLKIVVLTSSEAPVTSAADKLHFVRLSDETLASQINRVVNESDFAWFMLAHAGDEFTPSGLMVSGLELTVNPECRAIYGDQLQRLPDGSLGGAFLPSVNLDLLLSFPLLMARHWIFRRDVFIAVGGFDSQFADALEFDVLTRLIEQEGLVGLGHVSEPILITDAPVLRDNPDERRVIERHLASRGYQAQILPGLPARYRIHYGHKTTPLVSIIIDTNVVLARLQQCLDSLLEKTRYSHYEILLADSGASDANTRGWLQSVAALGDTKLRVVFCNESAELQNRASKEARGDYLLLLSGESVIIREDWLDELLNHGQRPEVGVVGGKLLTEDGRIDQAGLLLGLRGPVARAFAGESMDAAGYLQRLQVDQNYSAVGDACLLVRADLFRQLGGLDTTLNAYRGVDFCLRVRAAGYLVVWAAYAVLLSEDKHQQPDVAEQDRFYERYLPELARDPAYNRNLALSGAGFDLERDTGLTWRPLSWRPLPVVLAHPADLFGCGNYRVIRPFSALKEAGMIDGMMSVGLLQVPDLERFEPGIIVLQRQIGDERLEAIRRIKALSKAFKIYELDDYLPNLPMKSVHRKDMPKDVMRSLRKGLSYVDRFVVSTESLAESFSGLHDDIRVIENRLPVQWWKGLSSQRQRGRKPRVGWAGGSGHLGDLELIADVVRELKDEVEWVFFGLCPEKLRGYVHEVHAGIHIELYPAALAALDLDLALAPLEQNLFNECKSNLRLLEYGACGYPVICSDLRCYQGDLPVTRVKNRFRDWVDAIRMHISDLDATAKQGDELKSIVLNDWMLEGASLQLWHSAWLPN